MHIKEEIGLEVRNKLGHGSFGIVYECYNARNHHSYAVKVFYKKDFTKKKLQCFRKQSEILESLNHPNVVKFHSFRETDNCLYLLMEYISGGTLKQLIRKRRQDQSTFSDEEVSKILKALLKGIKYLHCIGIIHRDLKPENILLAEAGDLSSIKIADFGLSAKVDSSFSNNVKAQCGTLLYMAPEIFFQPSYSKAVDIWSCAVIMYLLIIGKHPLYEEGMSVDEYKETLQQKHFPLLEEPLANDFLKRISQIEYADRYSVNEALHHPWITRNSDDEIPLSVNQSINSFNTTHLVSEVLKFLYLTGKIGGNNQQVPSQYRQKVHDFSAIHQNYRARSPSFKKMNKTQGAIIKIKEIFTDKDKKEKNKDLEYEEISSPLIRKHEKLFSRLFQRTKQIAKKDIILLESIEIESVEEKKNNKLYFSQKDCQTLRSKPTSGEQESSFLSNMSPSKNSSQTSELGKYDTTIPINKMLGEGKNGERKLRKLNSMRQDVKQKETGNYFRNSLLKKSSIDFMNSYSKSRIKKSNSKAKQSVEKGQQPIIENKLQSSESKRSKKGGKEVKPMIFGIGRGF